MKFTLRWLAAMAVGLATLLPVPVQAGTCGARASMPMSLTITVSVWGAPNSTFHYSVDGPKSSSGTIEIAPNAHEASVLVQGLRPGTYDVSVKSGWLEGDTSVHIDPPGCGNAADFSFSVEPG